MGIFERFYNAEPKWQIVFGIILVLAGAFVAISSAIKPYHLFSQTIDGIIGISVAVLGICYAVVFVVVWHYKSNYEPYKIINH